MTPQIFIISYDEGEVQLPSDVTEFHLTTKATIEKGFLNTKVTDLHGRLAMVLVELHVLKMRPQEVKQ